MIFSNLDGISKNKFYTLSPYTSSKHFIWDNEGEVKPIWSMGTPKNNPKREFFITPPYPDELGLGEMVTFGKPIYYNRVRSHSYLGNISPSKFEEMNLVLQMETAA